MNIINYLLLSLLLSCSDCLAGPISDEIFLNYSGTVVIPPCTIATPTALVDFGNILASDLATSDSATDWKEAKLQLTGCSGVSEIDVTLNATPNSAEKLYIANDGTAEHLAVQAKMEIPTVMPAYDGITIPVHMVQGESLALIAFDFRIRNDGTGPATAGSVKSVVTLVFTFK